MCAGSMENPERPEQLYFCECAHMKTSDLDTKQYAVNAYMIPGQVLCFDKWTQDLWSEFCKYTGSPPGRASWSRGFHSGTCCRSSCNRGQTHSQAVKSLYSRSTSKALKPTIENYTYSKTNYT